MGLPFAHRLTDEQYLFEMGDWFSLTVGLKALRSIGVSNCDLPLPFRMIVMDEKGSKTALDPALCGHECEGNSYNSFT